MIDVLIHENIINFSIDESKRYSLYLPYYKKYKKKFTFLKEEEDLTSLLYEIELQEGTKYALALLAKRAYSSFEIQKKLSQRLFLSTVISHIIETLKEKKYLNEEEDVHRFLESLIRKGTGPILALQKLKEKFNRSFTLKEIEEIFTGDIQEGMILKLIRKKIGSKEIKDKKKLMSVYRYLHSKGFEAEMIMKICRNFF